MNLLCSKKPLAWKMLGLIDSLKLYGVCLPLLFCFLMSDWLMSEFSLGILWGSFLAAAPGLVITLLSFPLWFVKQTATPSAWQRWCRQYAIGLGEKTSFLALSRAGDSIQPRDIRFFQYYLSHPKNSENIWADQIDTSSFDWQDPAQWPQKELHLN